MPTSGFFEEMFFVTAHTCLYNKTKCPQTYEHVFQYLRSPRVKAKYQHIINCFFRWRSRTGINIWLLWNISSGFVMRGIFLSTQIKTHGVLTEAQTLIS
uniref:Uncharacterized protein n=1 Tax=Pyxicephalus adspersus TaxID=30357 RepID=A0AAV3AX68_PYXAD|nr:TPA: hypothetical protein GDO54_000343 [Pyxicephalus adspersus]